MKLEALIFDVDGTLADTEEVHRRAFNAAFAAHGLGWEWSPEVYLDLLRIPGGKERLAYYIRTLRKPAEETERLEARVPEIHGEKTRRFAELLAEGNLRARTGIARLVGEAREAGLRLGIATTTTPANVEALLPRILGEGALSWFHVIAAGDTVSRKKPDPEVYVLALERLGCGAARCVAFEDSDMGVRAARQAGLYTIATPTWWTAEHDLSEADLRLPSLGDPEEPLDGSYAEWIGGRWLGLRQLGSLHADWTARHPLGLA